MPTHTSAEAVCPNGTYCVNGTQVACPVGRFGGAPGLWNVSQCTVCADGTHCPLNSTFAAPCGGTQFYCINGERFNASGGWYTTPNTPGTEMFRTGRAQCEAGFFCSSGNRTACPAGKYGSSPGQASSDCGV